MATWQFDIHLLPSEGVLRRYQAIPVSIPKSDVDETEWWRGLASPRDLETEFLENFAVSPSLERQC